MSLKHFENESTAPSFELKNMGYQNATQITPLLTTQIKPEKQNVKKRKNYHVDGLDDVEQAVFNDMMIRGQEKWRKRVAQKAQNLQTQNNQRKKSIEIPEPKQDFEEKTRGFVKISNHYLSFLSSLISTGIFIAALILLINTNRLLHAQTNAIVRGQNEMISSVQTYVQSLNSFTQEYPSTFTSFANNIFFKLDETFSEMSDLIAQLVQIVKLLHTDFHTVGGNLADSMNSQNLEMNSFFAGIYDTNAQINSTLFNAYNPIP